MAKPVIDSVQTKGVGFAPILKLYFKKCEISQIIDDYLPLDPRKKIFSHGQAYVELVTGILFQVLQLYRLCKCSTATTVLEIILPGISPEQYFDDRLTDTLDAIYDGGIGNLEKMFTQKMIHEFDIRCPVCNNDTTSEIRQEILLYKSKFQDIGSIRFCDRIAGLFKKDSELGQKFNTDHICQNMAVDATNDNAKGLYEQLVLPA